jgi:tetrapyrrole methylase family protein/MazG family protein
MTASTPSREKIQALTSVIQTVHRLRAPNGCPWDRAQTHQSLRQYLIEEAYEVLDVIDEIKGTEDLKKEKVRGAFREELGDLLMQVLLHSEMASETGAFDFYDVAASLEDKLIRRHTHVFGETPATDAESAFQNWERQKAKEKASNPEASVLDGVPKGLPALQKAARVIEKVTKVGFQWNDMHGPLDKVEEELAEMKTEVLALEQYLQLNGKDADAAPQRKKLENELGDLFFTLCNVAYLMKVSPEDALRGTLQRFDSRFRFVERKLKETGKTPEQSNLEEMDGFWNEAKNHERSQAHSEPAGTDGGAD